MDDTRISIEDIEEFIYPSSLITKDGDTERTVLFTVRFYWEIQITRVRVFVKNYYSEKILSFKI